VSGADVAETTYTAFPGKDAMTVRLVVRRVRPTPGSELALFTTWDYHAFVNNRSGDMVEVEADHRRHAVLEQRIAELKPPGLAHLPSASSWPTPPGSRSPKWPTTSHAPAVSSLDPTSRKRPPRLCDSGSSPSRDDWSPAADADTCDYPRTWPWTTAIEQALTTVQAIPLRSTADHQPHPTRRLEAGRPALQTRL
jgi:hypothetical protein